MIIILLNNSDISVFLVYFSISFLLFNLFLLFYFFTFLLFNGKF